MEKEPKQAPATPEQIWATLDRVAEMNEQFSRRHEQAMRENEEFGRKIEKARKKDEQRHEQAMRENEEFGRKIEKERKKDKQRHEQAMREYEEFGRKIEKERKKDKQRHEQAMQEIAAMRKDADRRTQETNLQMQETDRRLRKAENLFTSQWGRLIESLVKGDLLGLLQGWGIGVKRLSQRIEGRLNGEYSEIDIVASSVDAVVVVEVKTTLRPEDVKEFVEKLGKYALYMDEWSGRKLYGAVAYLDTHESVRVHAERQGLLVIRATGNSASIVNDQERFRIREYRSGEFMPAQPVKE